MRLYLLILIVILFIDCNTNSKDHQQVDTSRTPNIIKVEQYNDTTRLEIEKRGDTLIKHFIDLKGRKDDNFDDSFTARCTYKQIANDSTVRSDLYFEKGEYRVYFQPRDVIAYCDSALARKDSTTLRLGSPEPQDLRDLRTIAKEKPERGLEGTWLSELLVSCKMSIINIKTLERPKAILIEFYETEFSGGKNYSIITMRGDTVNFFGHMDWIS